MSTFIPNIFLANTINALCKHVCIVCICVLTLTKTEITFHTFGALKTNTQLYWAWTEKKDSIPEYVEVSYNLRKCSQYSLWRNSIHGFIIYLDINVNQIVIIWLCQLSQCKWETRFSLGWWEKISHGLNNG